MIESYYGCEGLSEYEKDTLLPIMITCLEGKRGKGMAVTNATMRRGLQAHGYKMVGEPRVRKIINFIRTNGLVDCLIANSEGYYVSRDTDEIEDYIQSLKQRENAIRAVREKIEEQCQKLRESNGAYND